ncbi:MAG: class I SAM-dependent RNA methyltransferase, partial [Gemmatimonadaceae bacterium]|nr:class I SAM-dependent RNA methyltransferase [Gemmatimonadaceae bacterium]
MAAAARGSPEALDLFAVCAPGVEPFAAAELRALGVEPRAQETGGLAFTGSREVLYRANLHLRTVSRVIARVGAFSALNFAELERRARREPWERWIAPGRAVRLRVTCRKSRLYHSDAVAERLARAIAARLGRDVHADVAVREEDDAGDAQLVIARVAHDRCTLSVDSSGALLHARGYRLATAKAPLRETLAAALLAASGWDARAPLLDPFCGAGTIAIEGALIARTIAPGLARRFAFMEWPDFDRALWTRLVDE